MNQQPRQPAARVDLRQQMPETAKWVEVKRKEWGAEYVNACIRRSLKGEPGYFYAMEAGHCLGAPFSATHPIAAEQNYALLMGCTFAVFMATPTPGASNGAH
ncbi:MAG: hypothetical protein A3I66_00700 [Burkholderiales bacterium RIFCSPLOWO2_02_FULL_57_36]|nr:MAG: hypothetical protein A3I66_00700 [Burkholderiales bacterium RIFCSPLOWO2_02_FULL_57_36]